MFVHTYKPTFLHEISDAYYGNTYQKDLHSFFFQFMLLKQVICTHHQSMQHIRLSGFDANHAAQHVRILFIAYSILQIQMARFVHTEILTFVNCYFKDACLDSLDFILDSLMIIKSMPKLFLWPLEMRLPGMKCAAMHKS